MFAIFQFFDEIVKFFKALNLSKRYKAFRDLCFNRIVELYFGMWVWNLTARASRYSRPSLKPNPTKEPSYCRKNENYVLFRSINLYDILIRFHFVSRRATHRDNSAAHFVRGWAHSVGQISLYADLKCAYQLSKCCNCLLSYLKVTKTSRTYIVCFICN